MPAPTPRRPAPLPHPRARLPRPGPSICARPADGGPPWAAAGERVVLTNGCFDLLHVGHTRYLAAARALGDRLVVALNDDASTHRLKGPGRPILPLAERAELLCALRWVDAVVAFGAPTAVAIVTALRPDVYVKGGDYAAAGNRPRKPTRPKPSARASRSCRSWPDNRPRGLWPGSGPRRRGPWLSAG